MAGTVHVYQTALPTVPRRRDDGCRMLLVDNDGTAPDVADTVYFTLDLSEYARRDFPAQETEAATEATSL